jgi:hypothetical protein
MNKIKRFKVEPHLRIIWMQANSQLSSKIQEVSHTTNLLRVRTIVRREASRTRPKAIKLLMQIQTIDLTTVTDSSSSSNNLW